MEVNCETDPEDFHEEVKAVMGKGGGKVPVRMRKPDRNPDGSAAYVYLDSNPTLLFLEEFKCPICLGPLEKTFATMGCLHRFCSECLQRALRVDLGDNTHHSCPSCRGKLASRRASNHDPRFDDLMNELLNAEQVDAGVTVAGGSGSLISPAPATAAATTATAASSSNISPRSSKRVEIKIDLNEYRRKHEANIEMLKERAKETHEKFMENRASLQGMVNVGVHHVSQAHGSTLPPRSKRQLLIESLRVPYLKLPPELFVGDLKRYLVGKLQRNWFHCIVTLRQAQLARDLVGGLGYKAGPGLTIDGEGLSKAHDNTVDLLMPSHAGVVLTSTSRRVHLRELYVESLQLSVLRRGSMIACEDAYTMQYICQHIWDRSTPLILYFEAVWRSRLGVDPFPSDDCDDEGGDEEGYEGDDSWRQPAATVQTRRGAGGGGGAADALFMSSSSSSRPAAAGSSSAQAGFSSTLGLTGSSASASASASAAVSDAPRGSTGRARSRKKRITHEDALVGFSYGDYDVLDIFEGPESDDDKKKKRKGR